MIFVYMTVLNGFQNHQAWFLLFFIKDFTVVITAKNPPCISEREGIGSDYLTEEWLPRLTLCFYDRFISLCIMLKCTLRVTPHG